VESPINCERFDELLSDYLEETLDARQRAAMDTHAGSCVRCTAILRDVAGIRAEASRLPSLTPSRDLWQGIAARIEPTVVPLAERRTDGLSRRWIAVAAAALIASTAGVTYLLTSRTIQSRPATVATAPVAEEPTGPRDSTPAIAPAPSGETTVASTVPAPRKSTPSRVREERAVAVSTKPTRTPSAVLTSRALSATEIAYGDEITRLQSVIASRRKDLDPSTVSVIEENLKVIDAALKKSRDALARDPASGLLTDQLNSVLDKKVELLRTVALLPSRT
jgi:putative zinc finger protein